MKIAERTRILNGEWLAKELDIDKEEAAEILEILAHRGDLRGRHHSGWYTLRKHFNQQTRADTNPRTHQMNGFE